MKRIRLLLCLLLATVGLFAKADTYTVTVNIDDASHLVASANGSAVELVNGDNTFTFEDYYSMEFAAVDPWGIKSVENVTNGYQESVYNGRWYAYFNGNTSYRITTYNVDEARTATATVNVDDATKVRMVRAADYFEMNLQDGANTIKFNPETETYVTIVSRDYSVPLYEVKQNGEVQQANYGSYNLTLADGDVIDVTANIPDKDVIVTFSYNEGGEGCIGDVKVNGEPAADFDGKTLVMKAGQQLSFKKDIDYIINDFFVNGSSTYMYDSYSMTVMSDTELRFDARYDDDRVTLSLNVDDASHILARYSSTGSVIDLVNGDNSISVKRNASVEFQGVSPWVISKVVNTADNTEVQLYGGRWSYYASADGSFAITTANADDARSASATFNVDNASQVSLYRNGTSGVEQIKLVDGANTVRFDPANESYFTLYSASSTPIYQVSLNGVAQPLVSGGYQLMLTDGAVVDIVTKIPDVDVNVTFTYNSAGQGCVSTVTVDGVTVEDFDGKSLTMKAGQTIGIVVNSNYIIDSFSVNGKTTGFYGSYSAPVMTDTEFFFIAHLPGNIKATVIVDDPETITLGAGAYYVDNASEIISLKAGENIVEVSETNPMLCWKANDGCYIERVELNGNTLNAYNTYTNISEGDVLKFVSGKITMDRTAVIWIDNKELAETYFGVSCADRSSVNVSTGYNVVPFYAGMLPINISWYSNVNSLLGQVYLNNELVVPPYTDATSYDFSRLADKDVIKVFLGEEPVECTLLFNIDKGIEVTATVDRVTPVADFNVPMTVFAGTEVEFTVASDEPFIVSNGDDELTPDEDGRYVVTVNGTTPIIVSGKGSGIGNIAVEVTEDAVIYDIYGRRVAKPSRGSIYIINGRKVYVK